MDTTSSSPESLDNSDERRAEFLKHSNRINNISKNFEECKAQFLLFEEFRKDVSFSTLITDRK